MLGSEYGSGECGERRGAFPYFPGVRRDATAAAAGNLGIEIAEDLLGI